MDQKKIIFKKDRRVIKEIYWHKNFNSSENAISLVDYIDKNSIILRQKLLNFFDKIKTDNLSLLNNFYIENDFNYWFLTNFSEKNLYKKNHFFKILKSLVVLDMSDDIIFDEIIININDKDVINILKNKFKNKNFILDKGIKNEINKNFIFEITSILKAIIFIFTKIFYSRKKTKYDQNRNLFVSFSAYINLNFLKKKKFTSLFWGNINNISKCNFLHLFIENEKIKTFNNFKKKIFQIKNDNEIHDFLDSYINLKNIFKIIIKSLKIKFFFFLSKKKFIVEYKNLNIVRLIYYDLNQSFLYFNILKKIYYFYLFESFFKQNKFCANCFFIYENQPWEKSLIHHWKKNNSSLNKIFGVVSTSVRFWDIRYSLPSLSPNKILANGESSYSMLRDFGHKQENLDMVESLRYAKNSLQKNDNKNYNILILGDYSKSSNSNLIKIINSAKLSNKSIYFLKEHPLRSINCKEINLRIKKTSLSNMFFKIVITTNTTAAAIDHYLRGSQIITVLDDNNFNLSPLKNKKSVKFVRNGEELKDYITTYDKNNKNYDIDNFYLINSDLSRWNKYLI